MRKTYNARYKDISFHSACASYFMVRVFGRSIDRDQSFFPRCFDFSLFFILVLLRKEKRKKDKIMLDHSLPFLRGKMK
uniref:Uncharacterized protein n=1 Tax=Cycas taitungensis TaxID=54799 RepID=A6H5K1_CYCTA|nr:hypothetical protein CYtaCp060 [Cycas taitungensis]BAF64967.1 hypothetical protein [Cycas taitungensis]